MSQGWIIALSVGVALLLIFAIGSEVVDWWRS